MIVTDRLASYGAEKGRCDSKAQDRPVVEQPHRELSPAIATTGASDAPVQANEKPAETRRSPWPGPQPLRFAALRVNQERTLISRRNFAPRTFGSKDRRSAALTAWRHPARPEQGWVWANSDTILVCHDSTPGRSPKAAAPKQQLEKTFLECYLQHS
jgi:hypothetical protein